jgi:Response regulator containing a CheY-like receiver domain and an HTH DNA-binding domain
VRISQQKAKLLKRLITDLYERPFDETLAREKIESICKLLDSQYLSLYFLPGHRARRRYTVTNNPTDYVPIYLAASKSDYILKSLIETRGQTVLRRIPEFDSREHRAFNCTVFPARPISDLIYIPIKIDGDLRGYWSLARDGKLSDPAYSKSESELFAFVASFLNDAIDRSLRPPPPEDDCAMLDRHGRLVCSGARIEEVLALLFGKGMPRRNAGEGGARLRQFLARYKHYLEAPLELGADRIAIPYDGSVYDFILSPVHATDFPPNRSDNPVAELRLIRIRHIEASAPATSGSAILPAPYELSPREREVVAGILAGKSNKLIAYELHIDEDTVKHHTHSIYEKTGYKSRIDLVINFPRRD